MGAAVGAMAFAVMEHEPVLPGGVLGHLRRPEPMQLDRLATPPSSALDRTTGPAGTVGRARIVER